MGILQPCVYVPFFFALHGFMMGESVDVISSRVTSEYCALLVRLWSLYMPTRLVMFLLVPLKYQVLWDSSVSFVWQTILSLFDAGRARSDVSGMIVAVMG